MGTQSQRPAADGEELIAAAFNAVQVRERWCVHIPGPDDLYPQESREAAEDLARAHNAWAEAHLAERWKDPLFPSRESCLAVVIPWPHEAVSDAHWARLVAAVRASPLTLTTPEDDHGRAR